MREHLAENENERCDYPHRQYGKPRDYGAILFLTFGKRLRFEFLVAYEIVERYVEKLA